VAMLDRQEKKLLETTGRFRLTRQAIARGVLMKILISSIRYIESNGEYVFSF
jgi:hypothetical protein